MKRPVTLEKRKSSHRNHRGSQFTINVDALFFALPNLLSLFLINTSHFKSLRQRTSYQISSETQVAFSKTTLPEFTIAARNEWGF